MIRRILLAAVPILAGWTSVAQGAVAVASRDRLWLDGVVPYSICETGPERCKAGGRPLTGSEAAKVREAVAQWNERFGAELRFEPTGTLARWQRGVRFSRSSREAACSTDRIGRPRDSRRTNVKLGDRCNSFAAAETPVGTVLHEMMHVAGFYHEHQRPDRDEYLQPRIKLGLFDVLFDIKGAQQWVKGRSLHGMHVLTPYDFQSIMHYPIRDSKKAVLTLDGFQRLESQGLAMTDPGRRDGFSPDDIAGVKQLYGQGRSAMARSEALAKPEHTPL